NLFQAVLGGDSLPTRKPDPEPLWEALDRMKSARDRAVMVGDSLVDIRAARAARVPVVAVTYGFRPAEELSAAAPDALIQSFKDLTEVLS
ncbi:MAG TPA: HAD-IA family hydrolase, partial [Elusimicrobiota bacterium]|nr:HAD-IA family hydrolase [Elusimicrobiota bacterium]